MSHRRSRSRSRSPGRRYSHGPDDHKASFHSDSRRKFESERNRDDGWRSNDSERVRGRDRLEKTGRTSDFHDRDKSRDHGRHDSTRDCRDRESNRDRDTHRDTHRDREGVRDRETSAGTQRDRQREPYRENDRDRESSRGKQRNSEQDRSESAGNPAAKPSRTESESKSRERKELPLKYRDGLRNETSPEKERKHGRSNEQRRSTDSSPLAASQRSRRESRSVSEGNTSRSRSPRARDKANGKQVVNLSASKGKGNRASVEEETTRSKRRRNRSSSSDDSSSSDSDSSVERRRKEKKKLKKEKRKERKLKKKMKREARKAKKSAKKKKEKDDVPGAGPVPMVSSSESNEATSARNRAPMTKEEWEKQQSVVRRVVDPETGRTRLIKGDGEVLEEIVSKERHREINKQATLGDGMSFQAKLGLNRY